MKIKEDTASLSISFEPQDWNNGKARKTIEFLKSMKSKNGKPMAFYQNFTKNWKMIKTPYTQGQLDNFISSFDDHKDRVELDQESLFDVYWDEIERRNRI